MPSRKPKLDQPSAVSRDVRNRKGGYELLMTFLLPRADITDCTVYFMDESIMRSNMEDILDLRQFFVDSLMAVSSNQYHPMNVVLKSRNPVRTEFT